MDAVYVSDGRGDHQVVHLANCLGTAGETIADTTPNIPTSSIRPLMYSLML